MILQRRQDYILGERQIHYTIQSEYADAEAVVDGAGDDDAWTSTIVRKPPHKAAARYATFAGAGN